MSKTVAPRAVEVDVNAAAGAALRDMALAQVSPQKAFGYKRAAALVLSLEQSLSDLMREHGGALPKLPGIGPASSRVILEIIEHGISATVETAVADSHQRADIERRRGLRTHFLSRAEVLRVLAD